MMNANEMKNAIRDAATEQFLDNNPDALAVMGKDYTFVVPVEIEGKTYWARWGLTSCQTADTKARPAFNPDTDTVPAREAFENLLARRAADLAARAAKKKSKKKNEDEK